MDTGKTILSISCGTAARLTLTCSSSPSPSPVRLSPRCSMEPSGLFRLLKKMKCWSDSTLPSVLSATAPAARSKSVPVVLRTSQPRPTVTAVRPGASLLSETFPPLLRLTPTALVPSVRVRDLRYVLSGPVGGSLDPSCVRAKPNDLETPLSRLSASVGVPVIALERAAATLQNGATPRRVPSPDPGWALPGPA